MSERKSPSSSPQDDNPFAPPPDGHADQPWQPRRQSSPSDGSTEAEGSSAEGSRDGAGEGSEDGSKGEEQPPAWGSQWSSRQPGRQGGGFGGSPQQRPSGGPEGPGGPGGDQDGPGRGPGGLRWDPTDPAQRRARYSLLAGMWAFFFALFSIPQVALLLGALSVYWAISSLRAKPKPRTSDPDAPQPAAGTGAGAGQQDPARKPQTTAAVSGLIAGAVALAIVAATFAFQAVYSDYYTCVDDALTQTSRHSCEDLLPKQLRPLLSTQN
ncbi:hypothetical protein AB0I49_34430 [Streptomyces sp. NPDC050617]|uniref:hypothetical protein n=1 Tax=Streptomyces sp. NPDC050617 TaxID=3154628 RepID=UPI00343F3B9F